jgi:hypothetical protein
MGMILCSIGLDLKQVRVIDARLVCKETIPVQSSKEQCRVSEIMGHGKYELRMDDLMAKSTERPL